MSKLLWSYHSLFHPSVAHSVLLDQVLNTCLGIYGLLQSFPKFKFLPLSSSRSSQNGLLRVLLIYIILPADPMVMLFLLLYPFEILPVLECSDHWLPFSWCFTSQPQSEVLCTFSFFSFFGLKFYFLKSLSVVGILASNVQCSDLTFIYTLRCDHHTNSNNVSPCKVTAVLLTTSPFTCYTHPSTPPLGPPSDCSLFLWVSSYFVCLLFLGFTYQWNHVVFVFLCPTYFM